ncbi:ABC-2 type transport system ATP-binding protein [Paenibacillus castaneae]|uniref:ABC transporter ATP-binding protein n=1 Tax=Paenibacillus castaneae TaxID=474957 RepID=UPI000C9C85E5|nr:ABC transporter ATP-binding protein [Paenibacillus castaneae]NIK75320.1 ABC-2 type transport system ATP-binding protein [Paenibacillus castaneae]
MLINILTKRYGNSIVLKDLSLDFNQGEIIGLIGRNGAGKSTLMKIITQTIQIYDGSVADNHQVGYLIEEPKLFNNKTGLFHLTYFSGIYGNTFKLNEYERLLQNLQLFDVLNKKVKKYSLGMRQKLGIVISLLNNPRYIVLDEPTNGMDVETSFEVLQELRSMAEEWNVGILISSHKLEDIEAICDRVLLLEDGTIAGEQHFIKNEQRTLTLVFDNSVDLAAFAKKQHFGKVIHSGDKDIQIETVVENAEIFEMLNRLGVRLIDFTAEKKTLRSVYMNKFRGEYHVTQY